MLKHRISGLWWSLQLVQVHGTFHWLLTVFFFIFSQVLPGFIMIFCGDIMNQIIIQIGIWRWGVFLGKHKMLAPAGEPLSQTAQFTKCTRESQDPNLLPY